MPISGPDPVNVSGITCTFGTFPPVGNATITATYSGDPNFEGSAATPGSLTITQAATSVTGVAASPASIVYGTASVSLTATLNNTSNDAALTGGTVTFAVTNGAVTTYCTAYDTTVSGADPVTATATCTFGTLPPVGTTTVTATYNGDTNFQGSAATPGSLTITQAATSTMISALVPPTACGDQTLVVPVTVANTSNSAPLTGGTLTVQIAQGATVRSVQVAVSGAGPVSRFVQVPTGGLPTGSYTVTASYNGDTNFAGSAATPATITLVKANATVVVPTATATYGDASVTLTARVASGDGAALNGGTVTFVVKKGSQVLATLTSGPVSGASPVTVSVTLPLSVVYNAGNYTVEASYSDSVCSNTGTLTVARKVLWLKPTDRTVALRAANPATDPHGDPACPAPSYCLELTRSSGFAYGQSWAALSLASLRFQYARNPPSTNATEYVGKTYRITAFGVSSSNYDIRYDPGTMTVVGVP
ncbi:MAG: Ig-like domain repeat protein [Thermomicrobiales bacterium]